MTKDQVPQFFNQPNMLVGILHKNTGFLDIDVYDPELAAIISAEAHRRFPGCLERVGQYPKTAIVFGISGAGFKVRNTTKVEADGKSAQVEIRTLTRQAVAYGIHPETREYYKWMNGRELWDTPQADLPTPTQQEVEAFRDWAQEQINEWAGVDPNAAQNVVNIGMFNLNEHQQQASHDDRASEEQFLAALEYASPHSDYETWVQCLMAIHDFYGGSQAGYEVACRWSSAYQNFSADEVSQKWRSFERGKGTTYKTVFALAKQHGADLSAIARMGKPKPIAAGASNASIATQAAPAPAPAPALNILSSVEFAGNIQPPVYLIKGILQKGRAHSLTGYTGHGKTTLALHLMLSVALGDTFGGHECKQGNTLFIAGENPDNVAIQYAAAVAATGRDIADIPASFLPGHFQLSAREQELHSACGQIDGLSLIIIDSLQSFFEGDSDNNNVEMIQMAQRFRRLTELPSRPAVVIISHPSGKKPDKSNLVPRGGGAFTNELDGNFTVWAEPDNTQVMHWDGKHRGAPFEPINFVMEERAWPHLIDEDGTPLRLKHTRQQMAIEQANAAHKSETRDRDALLAIDGTPRVSYRTLGEILGVSKSTAVRIVEGLRAEKLVTRRAKKWVLTSGGREFLDDV